MERSPAPFTPFENDTPVLVFDGNEYVEGYPFEGQTRILKKSEDGEMDKLEVSFEDARKEVWVLAELYETSVTDGAAEVILTDDGEVVKIHSIVVNGKHIRCLPAEDAAKL